MQAAGNDFLLADCREAPLPRPEAFAKRACDRRYGVGADGVALLENSRIADCALRIYNADGSSAGMCGNACRCAAKYLTESGSLKKKRITLDTPSGIVGLLPTVEEGRVRVCAVEMGQPVFAPALIPMRWAGESFVGLPLSVSGTLYPVTCLSTGAPHAVVFCADPDALPVQFIGPALEHHPLFPDRVNADFAAVETPTRIRLRVWERGCGETPACGTGACATVAAAIMAGKCSRGAPVEVEMPGGTLTVEWGERGLLLAGPAEEVFRGEIPWEDEA